MMELGSGIALGALCVSGGAVAITAIRTFGKPPCPVNGKNGSNGKDGKNGINSLPCLEHSGVMTCLVNIGKNQDRHEESLNEIARDVKRLLER